MLAKVERIALFRFLNISLSHNAKPQLLSPDIFFCLVAKKKKKKIQHKASGKGLFPARKEFNYFTKLI